MTQAQPIGELTLLWVGLQGSCSEKQSPGQVLELAGGAWGWNPPCQHLCCCSQAGLEQAHGLDPLTLLPRGSGGRRELRPTLTHLWLCRCDFG